MAVKFQHQSLIPTSSSNVHPPQKAIGINFFYKEVVHLNQLLCRGISKQRWHLRYGLSDCEKHIISCRWLESRKCRTPYHKPKRLVHSTPLSSTDDGVTVNGSPQASSSSDVEEMRLKLDQSLQGEDLSTALVQSLHDAARSTEMAIKEHISSFAISWFSKTWLGVDKNAWVKTLSYQAAVHSLLQAAVEISSRGNGRDRDINVFVQRSLTRQSAPLEIVIRDELTAKQPTTNEWFWSEQHPMVVTTFVNLFERDPRFTAATTVCWKGVPSGSCSASDLQLLMLALSCIAAVTKIGPAKVSCSHFFSMVPDTTGRLMDMLIDFVPIGLAYSSIKDIGLRREFLLHFGPRAAACRVKNDQGIEEMSFWVDLVQKQLQRAIDRERIWSRLTTCESIEVLEKDLAIFGFFIALGRSTQSFLSANGFTVMDEPVEGIIRYLIGGSVLYYPQLSSISSYQLYVEVVCEELEWLPFYIFDSVDIKQLQGNKGQGGVPLGEAVSQVLDTCSHWMKSFIKYSAWLENPSNIKAARFLSRGHSKLKACRQDMGVVKNQIADNVESRGGRTESGSEIHSPAGRELDSFDKALESVEEALNRLEELLQELHLSNSNNGKEHLKAACSDLERIRKLKKEAEFLEASFRAKSASLEQGDDRPAESQKETSKGKSGGSNKSEVDRSPAERLKIMKVVSRPHGLWSFLVRQSSRKTEPGLSTANPNEYELSEQFTSSSMGDEESESNEIRRFELLRRELIELEKRVQRSTDGTQNDEVCNTLDRKDKYVAAMSGNTLVHVQKKESIIAKSIDKLKEASTDVWQGTQLLAIDVGAAVVLLKRVLTGDELTQKEKKALRRTLTDLASVVPIGFLMLLPVTAVGHAAMLAAIQRYVPSLIPSTYAPERLYLLRQLEKVKEMESGEINPDETAGASGLSRSSTESS